MNGMSIGYFPGCSGEGTSVEYEKSTRAVCAALGMTLNEIPDWNCCGSTPAHTVDSVLSSALAARVFAQGETVGISDVITPCPSCLKNLRNALNHMEDPVFEARVEALTERPLGMPHSIKSVLQVIVEDIGLDALGPHIRRSLKGLRVVPYYGCLLTRPGESMRFDDPENPTSLDRLLETLGAEVLPFPLKTDCCGASYTIPARRVIPRLAGRILDMADRMGADCIVVACPLCQMNLDLRQGQINFKTGSKYKIPVPYFTQLMAYAFGLPDADIAFNKLAVNVQPAFACMQRRAAELNRQEKEEAARAAAKVQAAAEAALARAQSAGGKDASEGAAPGEAERVSKKTAAAQPAEVGAETGGGA